MSDMIFDSGHLYVRVAGAIIKVDAATMKEVDRYQIAEEKPKPYTCVPLSRSCGDYRKE